MPKTSRAEVPLRVAPADPIPPPTPEPAPAWCRAVGTHAWRHVPPMVVLAGGTIRVTLYCDRCASWRGDHWVARSGAVDSHAYKYSDAYREHLDEERGTVRKALIDAGHPRPISAAAIRAERERAGQKVAPGLRVVRGGKGRTRDRRRKP